MTIGQTTIYKTLHQKLKIEQHEHHQKNSGRVSSSWSTNDTRRVTLTTKPVKFLDIVDYIFVLNMYQIFSTGR